MTLVYMCEKLHEAAKAPPPCELFPGGSGASFQRYEFALTSIFMNSIFEELTPCLGPFFFCSPAAVMQPSCFKCLNPLTSSAAMFALVFFISS